MGQNVIGIPAFSVVIHGKEKGLYLFANEGASGKTCLKRLIDRCRALGEPVSGFTYEDCLQGCRPLDLCKPTDRLVVMDRYDMYANRFGEEVRFLAERTTVLLDAKGPAFLPTKFDVCTLQMEDPEHFTIWCG